MSADRRRVWIVACTAALAAATALCGCGGVIVQDDFAVQRSGAGPGGNLTIVVNDAGTVRCDGKPAVPVTDPQLIQARYISTTLATPAQHGLTLPPQPGSVFRYYVRTPDGHVSFSDNSKDQPSIFPQLQLLTLQIAQQDCHLTQ